VIAGSLTIILLIIGNTWQLSLGVIGVAVVASGVAKRVILAHHAHPLRNHLHTVLTLLVASMGVAHISIVAGRGHFFPAFTLLIFLVGCCISGQIP
jgi:hypothetical protein